MEEKKQTITTEQDKTDQGGEVKPQPTVEELQAKLNEAQKEIERKEVVLQQTKRELRDARQRGGSKAEIESLGKRIEAQEEWLAQALDDLSNRVGGDYEEPKPTRKSYSQQLQERRTKPKPEESRVDPDAQKFLTYCDAMDLHLDYDDLEGCDPLVKEALGEGRNFKEGLKYLKDKMKSKETVDVDKLVDEKLQIALEKRLKDMGLTTGGAGMPSAPGGKTFTSKQIEDMSPAEYATNRDAIKEAQRQGRIRI